MLGTGYFLKIAKINSQREKLMRLSSKNQFPRNRKKSPIRKNKLLRKFGATRYTHLACLYRPSIIIIIYLQSQPSLMRPVGWGGVRDGNGFSRVTSSFHTLSAVCSGKLLVFIQYVYIISFQSRFYGSPVYNFWCLVLCKKLLDHEGCGPITFSIDTQNLFCYSNHHKVAL